MNISQDSTDSGDLTSKKCLTVMSLVGGGAGRDSCGWRSWKFL